MISRAVHYDFLEPPASLPRGHATNYVAQALRQAIVMLELQPGEVIDKNAVCARLGVSRSPVSEALARLQGEGLVDILPQRGSSVTRIRLSEVAEFMFMRKALESEAVRALVASGAASVLGPLKKSIDDQRAAAAIDDRRLFHAHDCAFHELLLSALHFNRIKTIIESARANVDRARRLIQSPRRLAVTIAEHEAIVSAIAAGDGNAAAEAMRRHIDEVMDELQSFVRDHPEHFADAA